MKVFKDVAVCQDVVPKQGGNWDMKVFIVVVFAVFGFFSWFMYYAKKFRNDYQLQFYCGVRGSGKSTFMTRKAIYWQKRGKRVYSNFEIFGCYKFDSADFGFYHIPPESVLILDECSTIWRNRDWKSFPKEAEQFIRYLRKYRIRLYCCSQNLDTDVKILSNMDAVFLLVKVCNVFSIAKRIRRVQVLHGSEKNEDGSRKTEGFITENYAYDLPTTWEFCFIPRWIKFFNSFEAPELPKKKYSKYQFTNEPYLYSLTHYWGYKKDQIKGVYEHFKHLYIIEKTSFQMLENEFYELLEV